MQEVTLKPCNARGKYMRISMISVEWDTGRRTFAATIMFQRTRDRLDNKPLGALLCADNQETMGKMLQEFNLLYPVREEMFVCIPEPGEGARMYSQRVDSR